MSSSRWIDFRDIKANVSIRQVLDYYGIPYKEVKGDKLMLACPIHKGDNERAFHVDLHKNVFKCFTGCKQGGNVLDLMVALEDLSIRDAALKLHELFLDEEAERRGARPSKGDTKPSYRRSGPASRQAARRPDPESSRRSDGALKHSPPPSRVHNEDEPSVDEERQGEEPEDGPSPKGLDDRRRRASPAPRSASRTPQSQPAQPSLPERNEVLRLSLHLRREHPYLESRGIGQEAVEEFGLGYCPRGILAGRIAIPIHNGKGELVAYVGRHPKGNAPKYKFPSGFHKSLELYNLHRASQHARAHGLILVEGFFDAINLWQLGVPNAVALMGTELSAAQEDLLMRHTDRVVLMLDGDEAGRAATEQLLPRLARRLFVKDVQLPEGVQPDGLGQGDPVLKKVVA